MNNQMWGAMLVSWLLLAPLIGIIASSALGGRHTNAPTPERGDLR